MSAGSGIAHSEVNANKDKEVKFLQVWVFPKQRNIEPRYDQKSFDLDQQKDQIVTVVAPDDEKAVWINQDAWFSLARLSAGKQTGYNLHKKGNGVYVFVIDGNISVNGQQLNPRDGFGIWETDALQIEAASEAQLLLIDVPMEIPGA